jgi:integrase
MTRRRGKEKVPGTKGVYYIAPWYWINFRDRFGTVRWSSAGQSLERAVEARAEIQRLARDGIRLPPRTEGIAELARAWIEQLGRGVKRGERSARTLRRYDELLESPIRTYFESSGRQHYGAHRVRSVDRFAVAAFAEHLSATVAPSTQQLALRTLSRLMEFAIKRDTHGYNPVEEWKRNQGPSVPKHSATTSMPIVLDDAELAALLAATPAHWRLVFQCMAETGMLISETLALRWHDIRPPQLLVRRILQPNSEITTLPKQDPRRRRIPLPDALSDALARQRPETTKPLSHQLVFTRDGHVRTIRSAHLAFKAAVRHAHLHPDLTPINLRHTFAARLIDSGLDSNQIASQLGNQHATSTHRTYAPLFAAAQAALGKAKA